MSRKLLSRPIVTLAFSVILSERWGWYDVEGEYQDLPDGNIRNIGTAATRFEAAMMAEDALERLRRPHPRMWIHTVNSESGERVLESLWTGGGNESAA